MASRAEAAELSLACASQIRSSLASLKRDVALSFRICSRDFGVLGRELLTALAASRDRERVAALTLDHERTARRRAQAKTVELQGLVRVVCRVRPLLPHEASDSGDTTTASRSLTAVRVVSQQDIHVVVPTSSVSSSSSSASSHGGDTSTKSFSCERVCGEDVSQQQLYREVQPLVAAAVEGQHACVFAYGQTGSGKTNTIHGTELDRGLVFRAAETIFDLVQEQHHVFDFNVTVQMVEIYNEEMYDLLGAEDNSSSPNGSSTSSSNAYGVVMPFQTSTNATHSPAFVSRRPLGEIRHGERGVYLRNVEAVAVHSAHDVLAVVQNGVVNRTVHSASGSDDHEHSSRSHCVIMIDVQRCSHMDGQVDGGRFVLVDLAGSERLLRTESSDSGQRIREAQHINKSLAAIGDVLSALLAKDKHVPYRNSKITHLLQESLGAADGQTLVLVHVSPTTADVTETVNTLKFAARVNRQQSAPKRRSERQEVNRLQGTIATQAAQLQALQDKLASELELRRKYEKRLEEYRQDDHRRRAKDEERGRLTPQSKQSQGTPTKTLGLGQQNSATPEQPYATRRWSLYARKEPLKPPSGSQTSRLQRGSAGGQENISENIMHTRSPAVPKMPSVAEKAKSMAATPMRRARRLSMMMHSDRKALQSPQRAAAHPGLKRKAETPAQVRSILKKQRLSLQPEQLASPPDDLPVPGATSKQVSFDLTTRTATRVGGIQLLPPSLPATGSSSSALPPRQPTSLLRTPMAAGRVLAPPGRVAARAPTHTGSASPKPRFRSSSLPTQGNKPKWNATGWR